MTIQRQGEWLETGVTLQGHTETLSKDQSEWLETGVTLQGHTETLSKQSVRQQQTMSQWFLFSTLPSFKQIMCVLC